MERLWLCGRGYSVSKAAMHPYVHNLASHYGHHGVNANAVALGTVGPTGPWLEALSSDPAFWRRLAAGTRGGRWARRRRRRTSWSTW